MFEKYSLDELYIGSISVRYPDDGIYDINAGGMLMMSSVGYGYLTILRKIGENEFIDLNNPHRQISMVRKPDFLFTTYTIDYVEPLSDYYKSDGKKRETFSRRQAIKEAKLHYNTVHQNKLALTR